MAAVAGRCENSGTGGPRLPKSSEESSRGLAQHEPPEPSARYVVPDEVASPEWNARRALAASLRALDTLCVVTDADAGTLDEVRRRVDAIVASLAALPTKTSREALREGTLSVDPLSWSDRAAMQGRANPIAPPVRLRPEGDRVVGELVFAAQHGGAPGLVHGGLVATLLDEVLGHVAILRGVPVATATLDVRYVAPTPLDVPLRCEAWLVRNAGRRWFVAGEVRAGDAVTARAEGVFVDVRSSSFAANVRALADRDG